MNQDSYAECLVARKKPAGASAIQVLLMAGILVAAGSILYIGLFGFLLCLLMCFLTRRVWGDLHLEYEYLFVDHRFSVDRIYNKSRRKHAAEYALEEIEIIGPENSEKLREWDGRVKKVEDYTSGQSGKLRYALIHQTGGICKKVLFEPDENLIHCMKLAAPRKMHVN